MNHKYERKWFKYIKTYWPWILFTPETLLFTPTFLQFRWWEGRNYRLFFLTGGGYLKGGYIYKNLSFNSHSFMATKRETNFWVFPSPPNCLEISQVSPLFNSESFPKITRTIDKGWMIRLVSDCDQVEQQIHVQATHPLCPGSDHSDRMGPICKICLICLNHWVCRWTARGILWGTIRAVMESLSI